MTDMSVIEERYELSCGRIREIAETQEVSEQYKDYFKKTAEFILLTADAYGKVRDGFFTQGRTSIDELRKVNRALYGRQICRKLCQP